MNTRISFSSNINFIKRENFFRNFIKGQYIDYKDTDKEQLVSDEFYTTEVRTCIAGGFIIPKIKSIGFHFSDRVKYIFDEEDIPQNEKERGLIIGSKDLKHRFHSVANFYAMNEYMKKRVGNISLFQQHMYPHGESNLHYLKESDTWTINTQYWDGKEIDVINLKTLLKAFKKIRIAKGDRLFFEGKEVMPKKAPILFESEGQPTNFEQTLYNMKTLIMRML